MSMTLDEAVSAVPQLALACIAVLTEDSHRGPVHPGSGLKRMRLVNKQLSNAMLGKVKGYTLNVDSKSDGPIVEMALLKRTRLSHLRVIVTEEPVGVCSTQASRWRVQTLRLNCFLHAMEYFIKSLTHLNITFPYSIRSNTADAMTVLLSPLAHTCPALQQLQLKGDFSRGLLVAFGMSCKDLHSLTMSTGASSDDLYQLSLIMPCLAHCSYGAAYYEKNYNVDDVGVDDGWDATGYFRLAKTLAVPCRLAILSSSSLTHIDFGCFILTHEIWHALSRALRRLRCSLSDNISSPPADLMTLRDLQHLELCCVNGYEVSLAHLVQILRVAPKVQKLDITGWDTEITTYYGYADNQHACIDVCITNYSIPDLVFLHDRVLAGLAVTSDVFGRGSFAGVSLSFKKTRHDKQLQADCLSSFMAMLPCFPAFHALKVCWPADRILQTPGPSITKLISTHFPSLTSLRILEHPINDVELVSLRSCAALRYLLLPSAQVTPVALGILCTCLPSLEVLQIGPNSRRTAVDYDVDYGVALQRTLLEWGSHVKVIAGWVGMS